MMYIHTKKAVKRGEPADRLFAVSYIGHYGFVAWKCTITPAGILHPAYKNPLKLDRLVTAAKLVRGRNGSQPTAVFKADSLYKAVTEEEVQSLINDAKAGNKGRARAKVNVSGSMKPKPVNYDGSPQDWVNFEARIDVKYGNLSETQRTAAAIAWRQFMDELRKI